MDLEHLPVSLRESKDSKRVIEENSGQASEQINRGKLKILDFIKALDPILTDGNYEIRAKGVELLSRVVCAISKEVLSSQEIEVLADFLKLRLIDHKSMEQTTLRCLLYFIDCQNRPANYNKSLVDFLKNKVNVRRMDPRTRRLVYELVKKIILIKQNLGKKIEGELIYSLVGLMEGENNPENLIFCFGIVSAILKHFEDIDPYIEDIFDWLASYYPLEYTPPEEAALDSVIKIQRSDLIEALYNCFYASPSNADCLINMLLEKLDSNLMSSKLESLNCLMRCYEKFPLDSIKKYNSTLWTAVRSNCLRKPDTLDVKFLELSLITLTKLSERLAEDEDLHFMFLTDIYDELAIAFRKPEMELFEPAAKLVTHAVLPSVRGFNYVLEKIVPISLNAVSAGELRPVPGLAYMLNQLKIRHPNAIVKKELNDQVQRLLLIMLDHLTTTNSVLHLLRAILFGCWTLEEKTLDEILSKLLREYEKNLSTDLESNIALICMKYKRLGHLGISCDSYQLDSLLDLIDHLGDISLSSFGLYLRMIIDALHDNPGNNLDSLGAKRLTKFLAKARERVDTEVAASRKDIVEKVALLHAIVLSKISDDNVQPIVLNVFNSDFCQRLVPPIGDQEAKARSCKIYLPVVNLIFKSLVVRNHHLASPLINLILNFITDDKVDLDMSIDGTRTFSSILHDGLKLCPIDKLEAPETGYKKFALFKQKFYMQSSKEIKIRYAKEHELIRKKQLLLCSLAVQIPHLPLAVYKSDIDWIMRELIRVLTSPRVADSERLLSANYECLNNLIQQDLSQQADSFLSSLIDLNLKNARDAKTLQVRRAALKCLSSIAGSFKDSSLLVYRPMVVDKLDSCLRDKKRLVRQAAADARLRWILIGQPIGS